MQVKIATTKLKPCLCGYKPPHVWLGYGSTPYDVFCPTCKKQSNTTMSKCYVTGMIDHVIDYWNKHVRLKTVEELQEETRLFQIEYKENYDPTGWDGYKIYRYYWQKGKGEVLHASCWK